MKQIMKISFLVWAVLLSFVMIAQPKNDKAKWSKATLSKPKEELKVGDVVNVILEAKIVDGWYIYGSDFDPECGPMVTTVTVTKDPSFEVVGKLKTVDGQTKFDDIFECNVTYRKKTARFLLPIKILSTNLHIVGKYEFQTCTIDNGQCLPGNGYFDIKHVDISVPPKGTKGSLEKTDENDVKYGVNESGKNKVSQEKETDPLQSSDIGKVGIVKIDSNHQVTISDTEASIHASTTSKKTGIGDCSRRAGYDDIVVNRFDTEKKEEAQDIWALLVFMGVAFASGLVALLTPCVFPMIPMTVSFFTHSSASRGQAIRKALLYGFSIVFIYVVIGIIVSKINGPGFATWLATHPVPNIGFFILFMIFAISFLGLFEIQLPSSFVNKIDAQSDKGGLIGTFFMAFTLVLVSFSCTGPIVGTILVESAGGNWAKPLAGMFGYSLAFAIPFTLFAIFPSGLQSLPKSGGWLNTVKVVLGLLELALALKFLSVADQVQHWHILDREVFLALWIAIFFVMGIYLLGKISFPHDSPLEKLGVFRGIFAIGVFAFVVYLLPGMWGAPLKILSGVLPPMTTQDFDIRRIVQEELGTGNQTICEGSPMYSNSLHLPHGIQGYFDIREAICCARAQNKPIFIDYTGHGCANCRQMENQVWSDPRVLRKLKEDYIVVALYGDDQKLKIPEAEQFTNKEGERVITLGQQNAYFLYEKFQQQSQPFYAVIGVNEEASTTDQTVLEELASPHAFDLDITNYLKFLDKGIKNFEKIEEGKK